MTSANDAWAAYCLDEAVILWGGLVDNALTIMDQVGDDKTSKMVPRYRIAQLMTPGFIFGVGDDEDAGDGVQGIHGAYYDEVG